MTSFRSLSSATNMKTIQVTCLLCVALLPSINPGGGSSRSYYDNNYVSSSSEEDPDKPLHDTRAKVDTIIARHETINNIFKPLRFLGLGGYSVSYRGELGQSKKMVAMKISPLSIARGDPVHEYLMYTYLNAINNTAVENYGIPAVYYYCANWEGCTLLAITLLEPQFNRLIHKTTNRLEDLDFLIILRELVRITKYIHSCGVCHVDFHMNNMMFRKNQGFIIDFNLSKEVKIGVEPDSDCRKMDWRKFLVELCHFYGFPFDSYPYTNTLKNIENMRNNDGLRTVLINFVINAFNIENAEPINYNLMHLIITREIDRRGVQEPALVSWLTDAQKNETIDEWSKIRLPAIEDIAEPKTHYIYPKPILDYFHNFT